MNAHRPMRRSTDLVEENLRLRAELEQARHQAKALWQQASTDELTGLLNRRGFLHLAVTELAYARAHKRSLTLVYVDVDGLKEVNDSAGHEAGDQLLVETAALLREAFRTGDVVARLGGDEFVVLARGFDGDGEVVRRRLARVGAALHGAGVQHHRISLSAGVVQVAGDEAVGIEDWLDRADQAMYAIKCRKVGHRRTRARVPAACLPVAV